MCLLAWPACLPACLPSASPYERRRLVGAHCTRRWPFTRVQLPRTPSGGLSARTRELRDNHVGAKKKGARERRDSLARARASARRGLQRGHNNDDERRTRTTKLGRPDVPWSRTCGLFREREFDRAFPSAFSIPRLRPSPLHSPSFPSAVLASGLYDVRTRGVTAKSPGQRCRKERF